MKVSARTAYSCAPQKMRRKKKCWIKALKTKVKSQIIARSTKRISEALQQRMLSLNYLKVSQKDILWFTTKSVRESKSPAVWLISSFSHQAWKHREDSCFILFSRHLFSIGAQKTHITHNERAPSSLSHKAAFIHPVLLQLRTGSWPGTPDTFSHSLPGVFSRNCQKQRFAVEVCFNYSSCNYLLTKKKKQNKKFKLWL